MIMALYGVISEFNIMQENDKIEQILHHNLNSWRKSHTSPSWVLVISTMVLTQKIRVRSHVQFVQNSHGLLHFLLIIIQQGWWHGMHSSVVHALNQVKKSWHNCQKLLQQLLWQKKWFDKCLSNNMPKNTFLWKWCCCYSAVWPPYSQNFSAAACCP